MTYFATEFPVKRLASNGAFVAQVVTWLRGTEYSTVLEDFGESELDGVAPVIRARSGEELRLRILEAGSVARAIGFRHDMPDEEGRLWRTEMVLRRNARSDGQDLLRLRTQCIARLAGVRLDTPRKPYLLKTVLQDGWGGVDGLIDVSDQPIWLSHSEQGFLLAQAVTTGEASRHLPTIYVSAGGSERWALSKKQIEQLAFDLGGVAHVLVEPDRPFSFKLRDLTAARNIYGGTIGLALPGRGIVRRFYLGGKFTDPRTLQIAIRDIAFALRTHMPSEGWDWTELQEQSLRDQRERERSRLTAAEAEVLYVEEIANLRDQIVQLKDQLARPDLVTGPDPEEALLPASLAPQIGPEIYPGELVDRLRTAAKTALARAEQDGLDARTTSLLKRFASLPPSAGLQELVEDLKRATKDPKRMADQLSELLCRHGYGEKPRSKHVVLEALAGFEGLEALTVPTTPGDIRSLKNMRKQVERTLGLNKLLD